MVIYVIKLISLYNRWRNSNFRFISASGITTLCVVENDDNILKNLCTQIPFIVWYLSTENSNIAVCGGVSDHITLGKKGLEFDNFELVNIILICEKEF